MSVIGMPRSCELITVHLPVPFWPAVSRILSTSGEPSSSFFAAGDTGADVEQSLALAILHAAVGVVEKRVAAVDDDVARFEVRDELLDEFIHGLAGLDQH